MTAPRGFTLAFVVLSLAVGAPARAETRPENRDQICQLLFDAYIARRGKINTSTILAASHIIAERGRNNGFWRHVLSELQEGNEASEIGCVRILGKMLSIDASARDAIRRERETGEPSQWAASIILGPQVVEALIARGKQADRHRIAHYAIALARAAVPEAADFFRMILRDDNGKHHMSTAQFYAALGLAQLGDPQGVEWLIENSEEPTPIVSCAWPAGVADGNLKTSCVAALRMLSGEQKLSTRSEWTAWWQEAQNGFQPRSRVPIVDRISAGYPARKPGGKPGEPGDSYLVLNRAFWKAGRVPHPFRRNGWGMDRRGRGRCQTLCFAMDGLYVLTRETGVCHRDP